MSFSSWEDNSDNCSIFCFCHWWFFLAVEAKRRKQRRKRLVWLIFLSLAQVLHWCSFAYCCGITSPFHRVRSPIRTFHRALAMLAGKATSWLLGAVKGCAPHGVRAVASMCGLAPQGWRGSPGPAAAPQPALRAAPTDGAHPRCCKARPGAAGRSGVTAGRRQPTCDRIPVTAHLSPTPGPGRRALNSGGQSRPPRSAGRTAAARAPLTAGPSAGCLVVRPDMEPVSTFPAGGFDTSGLCGVGMGGGRPGASGPAWRLAGGRPLLRGPCPPPPPLPAGRTWQRRDAEEASRDGGDGAASGPALDSGCGERCLTGNCPCPSPGKDGAAFGLNFCDLILCVCVTAFFFVTAGGQDFLPFLLASLGVARLGDG